MYPIEVTIKRAGVSINLGTILARVRIELEVRINVI